MIKSVKGYGVVVAALSVLLVLTFSFYSPSSFQQFGQAFSGLLTATVSIDPLLVTIIPPGETEVAKPFSIDVRFENRGRAKITDLKSRIYLPQGLVLLGGSDEKALGALPGLGERTVSFRVKAEAVGSYIVLVSGTGVMYGTNDRAYSDDSAIIDVRPSSRRKPHPIFNFLSVIYNLF